MSRRLMVYSTILECNQVERYYTISSEINLIKKIEHSYPTSNTNRCHDQPAFEQLSEKKHEKKPISSSSSLLFLVKNVSRQDAKKSEFKQGPR